MRAAVWKLMGGSFKFLEAENAKARVQQVVHSLTDTCWVMNALRQAVFMFSSSLTKPRTGQVYQQSEQQARPWWRSLPCQLCRTFPRHERLYCQTLGELAKWCNVDTARTSRGYKEWHTFLLRNAIHGTKESSVASCRISSQISLMSWTIFSSL